MWCHILILTKDCANVFYVYLTDVFFVCRLVQLLLTCRPFVHRLISTNRALSLGRFSVSMWRMRAAASTSFAIMYR